MATKTKYIIEGENRTEHLFNELDRSLSKVDRRMQTIQSASLALGGALGIAFGGAKLIGAVASTVREFDVLTASLETVTGSSGATQEALAWIEPFAAKTPFQLNEVVDGFVKLTALGLKPSERALVSYGNTASAMGKSLNQFIEAVADATTGEFERLKEFGIKSSSQGDQVTLTFRGVSKTIAKEADAIEGYLRNIGEVEFAGAMTKRAETLDGALSNLEDSASKLLRAFGTAGLTQVISDGSVAMATLADNMARAVQEGDGLLRVFSGLGSGISLLASGSDQKQLAELELDINEAEKSLIELEAKSTRGISKSARARRIKDLREEIELLKRQREGLLTVLQPEEIGAAPSKPADKPAPVLTPPTVGGGRSKEFERDVKAFEKLVRENEKLQRDFAKDRDKLAADQAEAAAALTEELRMQQTTRLEDLERSLLTERELVQVTLDDRLQLLRVAREQELDATMEFAELEKRIREDAAKEISLIEKRELDDLTKDAEEKFERLTRAVQGWGDQSADAILDFVTGAEGSFGSLVDSILKDIARLAIRQAITDPIGDFLGSALKGAFSTGSRAFGGPAFRGQPLVVGETGRRELFIPHTDGRIVPEVGTAVNVNVEVINNTSAQVQVQRGSVIDGEQQLRILIGDIVDDRLSTSGGARVMGQRFGVRPKTINR